MPVVLQGCVSQVWVVPEVKDEKIFWQADSDAQLTKGLAALLVQGLSGSAPREVANIDPEFIEMLGLKQSLTPSRNNGFLNMFRLMQARASVLALACDNNVQAPRLHLQLPRCRCNASTPRLRMLAP